MINLLTRPSHRQSPFSAKQGKKGLAFRDTTELSMNTICQQIYHAISLANFNFIQSSLLSHNRYKPGV
jgi:hypothetical protein